MKTAFANGEAANEILQAGSATPSTKTDKVAADTIVLPNTFPDFIPRPRATARRPETRDSVHRLHRAAGRGRHAARCLSAERIETPKQVLLTTRYSVMVSNPQAWLRHPAERLDRRRRRAAAAERAGAGARDCARRHRVCRDADNGVLDPRRGERADTGQRLRHGRQRREAGKRHRSSSRGDPDQRFDRVGDRDGIVAGIPVLGQIAADLVGAGIAVVRYDRRGTGQSGGRSETTTINDYAEDVRAIVTWLEKQRRTSTSGDRASSGTATAPGLR